MKEQLFLCALVILIILGCKSTKKRLVHESYNVAEVGYNLAKSYTSNDTVIHLYSFSYGDPYSYLCIFEKNIETTLLKQYSNYFEFNDEEISFDWNYIINNFKAIKDEELTRETELLILDNGDSVYTHSSFSHGPSTRIEVIIGGNTIKYNYMEMEYSKKLNPYKLQLVDNLKEYIKDLAPTLKNYKLKPRFYNPNKRYWQRWDRKHKGK